MYTYWTDINFKASMVRVSHKAERGWTPKAYKEREIPIPAKLQHQSEGVEGEGREDMRFSVSHFGMQGKDGTSSMI